MELKRVNITMNDAAHSRMRELVDTLYGGNFSRFVSDAAIYFAGFLNQTGRDMIRSFVATRQNEVQIPRVLYENGAQVSVLICGHCGNPNPHQVETLSPDTINVVCPHCGNDQVMKGFRPSTTWIPPDAAVRAYCGYHSGEREGALDPRAVQLVKRHFAHRKLRQMTAGEWSEAVERLERERVQLNEMQENESRRGE